MLRYNTDEVRVEVPSISYRFTVGSFGLVVALAISAGTRRGRPEVDYGPQSSRSSRSALNAPQSTVVPFQLVDGRILIEARLDGAGPFHFIFDSGASAVLSPEVAGQLGLQLSNQRLESGTGSDLVELATGSVRRLEVGQVELENQVFDITSMRDMPPMFGRAQIDGILGRPLFDKMTIRVDYDQRTIAFYDSENYKPGLSDIAIPFTRIRDVPLIEASLDGHTGRFGVDLGARSSLIIMRSFADQNDLVGLFDQSAEIITGWGLGGPIKSKLGRARSFEFGGIVVHDPLVRLSAQKSGLLNKSDIAGLIGADILQQFMVTFDPVRHFIYFHPGRRFGEKTRFDQSGMWLLPGRDALDVAEIVKGGAAERAHIIVGDQVIAVDGRPVTSLRLPELRERWADAAPRTRVTLRIRRNGVVHTTLLRLTPIV